MLPGVSPTGKYITLPHVVIMNFKDGKIAHEHIYWDQASLLVQVGLLDPRIIACNRTGAGKETFGAIQQADNNTKMA